MKDEYITSLLLFFAMILKREKKSTVRVILYREISIDLSITLSIELSAEYREQKKEWNKLDFSRFQKLDNSLERSLRNWKFETSSWSKDTTFKANKISRKVRSQFQNADLLVKLNEWKHVIISLLHWVKK